MYLKLASAILLFVSIPLSAVSPASEEALDHYLESVSNENKNVLEDFFRNLFEDGVVSYVLYGKKPIAIAGYDTEFQTGALWGFSAVPPLLYRGAMLWRSMKVAQSDKEFIILDFAPDWGGRHLIFINRKVFLDVVNKNIGLFRYALGPMLTPEQLLKTLIESQDDFYKVLKHDNVLLGILLGYGTENALLVPRKEFLNDAFCHDREEEFPYLSRKQRFHNPVQNEGAKKVPSLGYSTPAEEYEAICQRVTVTGKLRPKESYPIPYFGVVAGTEETNQLLEDYTTSRLAIMAAVEKKDFLQEVLHKLFTTVDGEVAIPSVIPSAPLMQRTWDREKDSTAFAHMMLRELQAETFYHHSYLETLATALSSPMQEGPPKEGVEEILAFYSLEQELKKAFKLDAADKYMKTLSLQPDIVVAIPGKVYYRVLQQGSGATVIAKTKAVSFHYSYRLPEDEKAFTGSGTVTNVSPTLLLPGVAHALVGMQPGEKREVYIHPDFGYHEEGYRPTMQVLSATIELLQSVEGDDIIVLATPESSQYNDVEVLLERYRALRRQRLQRNGIELGRHLLEKNHRIDIKQVIQTLLSTSPSPDPIDDESKNRFLLSIFSTEL